MTHGGKGLARVFFCLLLSVWAHFGFRSILTLYLMNGLEVSDREAFEALEWYWWLIAAGLVAGGLAIDRITDAWRLLVVALSAQSVGALIISLPSLPLARGGVFCMAAGAGLSKVALIFILVQEYRGNRGHCLSTMFLFLAAWMLGGLAGPYSCGYLGETVGFAWGFGVAAGAALVALVLSIDGLRRHRGSPQGNRNLPMADELRVSWTRVGLCLACWVAVPILAELESSARFAYSSLLCGERHGRAVFDLVETTIQPATALACLGASLALWRLGTGGRRPALQRLASVGFLLVALASVTLLASEPSYPWLIVADSSMAIGEVIILAALVTMLVRSLPPGIMATAIGAWFAIPFVTGRLLNAYPPTLQMALSVETAAYVAVPAAVIGVLLLLSRRANPGHS